MNGRRVYKGAATHGAGRLERGLRVTAVCVLFVLAWNTLDALRISQPYGRVGLPPWYLPPTLTLFLILACGLRYAPLALAAPVVRAIIHPSGASGLLEGFFDGLVAMIAYGGAAYVLRAYLGFDPLRRRIRDLANLVLVGGLAAPFAVASVLTLFAFAHGTQAMPQFAATLGEHWIGRAVGIVAFLPLLSDLGTAPLRRFIGISPSGQRRHLSTLPQPSHVETAAQSVVMVLTLTLAFATSAPGLRPSGVLYLYFVPLAWIVVRRGLEGAIVVNAGTDLAFMVLSVVYRYPSAVINDIQQFMLAVTLSSLLLGGTVSARARAERKFRIAREQLARAQDASSMMILHVSLDGRCVKATRAFCALLERTPQGVEGVPFRDLVAPEDRPQVESAFHRVISGETRSLDLQARFLAFFSKRRIWLYLDMSSVQGDSEEPGFVLVFAHDITAQQREAEEVAYLAYHDALTGLPNRSMVGEHLTPALERARRTGRGVAAIFIDLDGFKDVNDELGHAAGDEVLKQIATRFRNCARATDLVARLSGDEFLVLITDIERMAASGDKSGYAHAPLAVASNIHRALESPLLAADRELHVRASLGISVFPTDAQGGEMLIQHADEAMYRAKRGGRAQTRLFEEEDTEAKTLSARIFQAAGRREFLVYYQPIVDLHEAWQDALRGEGVRLSRAIVGVEALIRWNDRGTLIRPDGFLPFLESSGLIEEVAARTNAQAVRQAARWIARGQIHSLSINLSLRQLQQVEVAERFIAMLAATHVDPRRVIVDIPEGTAVTHPERTTQVVRVLSGAGVRVAIDGFGTGNCSLTRLQELSVESLKIDRAFVAAMVDDARAAGIVAAVLGLASNLNMEVVAEGVETDREWLALIGHGCRLGQGYRFSQPLSAADMSRLFNGVSMV